MHWHSWLGFDIGSSAKFFKSIPHFAKHWGLQLGELPPSVCVSHSLPSSPFPLSSPFPKGWAKLPLQLSFKFYHEACEWGKGWSHHLQLCCSDGQQDCLNYYNRAYYLILNQPIWWLLFECSSYLTINQIFTNCVISYPQGTFSHRLIVK